MSIKELYAEWQRLQEIVERKANSDRALALWEGFDALTDRILALVETEPREREERDQHGIQLPPGQGVDTSHDELNIERQCLERVAKAKVDPDKRYALMLELHDLSARTLTVSRRETAIVKAEYKEWKKKKQQEDWESLRVVDKLNP